MSSANALLQHLSVLVSLLHCHNIDGEDLRPLEDTYRRPLNLYRLEIASINNYLQALTWNVAKQRLSAFAVIAQLQADLCQLRRDHNTSCFHDECSGTLEPIVRIVAVCKAYGLQVNTRFGWSAGLETIFDLRAYPFVRVAKLLSDSPLFPGGITPEELDDRLQQLERVFSQPSTYTPWSKDDVGRCERVRLCRLPKQNGSLTLADFDAGLAEIVDSTRDNASKPNDTAHLGLSAGSHVNVKRRRVSSVNIYPNLSVKKQLVPKQSDEPPSAEQGKQGTEQPYAGERAIKALSSSKAPVGDVLSTGLAADQPGQEVVPIANRKNRCPATPTTVIPSIGYGDLPSRERDQAMKDEERRLLLNRCSFLWTDDQDSTDSET